MSPQAHHYGVTVSDLDRALELYRDDLGLAVADRFTLGSETFNELVGTTDRSVDVAFLDADGCLIELVEYDRQGPNRNDGTASNDVGVAHFCLEVEDVRARYDDLSEEYDAVSGPRTLENGATVVMLLDPDGNVVELLEE